MVFVGLWAAAIAQATPQDPYAFMGIRTLCWESELHASDLGLAGPAASVVEHLYMPGEEGRPRQVSVLTVTVSEFGSGVIHDPEMTFDGGGRIERAYGITRTGSPYTRCAYHNEGDRYLGFTETFAGTPSLVQSLTIS